MPDLVQVIQSLVSGIGVGLIYGLVGIGFCVIYNASGIVNFAQGVFVMLGGMITHVLLTRYGLHILFAALIAIPLVALIGIAIELLVVRPMWDRGATMFAIILATLAAQIMIERITILTAGDQPRTLPEFTLRRPPKIGPRRSRYQLVSVLRLGAPLAVPACVGFRPARTGPARVA